MTSRLDGPHGSLSWLVVLPPGARLEVLGIGKAIFSSQKHVLQMALLRVSHLVLISYTHACTTLTYRSYYLGLPSQPTRTHGP